MFQQNGLFGSWYGQKAKEENLQGQTYIAQCSTWTSQGQSFGWQSINVHTVLVSVSDAPYSSIFGNVLHSQVAFKMAF